MAIFTVNILKKYRKWVITATLDNDIKTLYLNIDKYNDY